MVRLLGASLRFRPRVASPFGHTSRLCGTCRGGVLNNAHRYVFTMTKTSQNTKRTIEMNKKIEASLSKAKDAAASAINKGNEAMDKVSFLKNPLHKKIAWGILAVVAVLLFARICGCGGSRSPYDVAHETMIALVEGDIETYFENMYVEDEMRQKLSKLSKTEARVLEEKLVEGFFSAVQSLSDDERKIMLEKMAKMKHASTKVEGDTAIVEVSMPGADGDEVSETYTLRKVDGDWKFVPGN